MKRKALIIILFLCCLTVSAVAQKTGVEITYIGNAGFMIETGDKKILIDALFKGFEGNYKLPQQVQDKLTRAEAPFDDVDLILVTHAHGDHVSPNMVRQHMQNNPDAVFASTQQLVNHMKDSTGRSIGFNPTKEKPDKKEIQGITIESFLLPHGDNAQIINIGFLISVNGITIFQTGDADFDQFTFEEFRSLQLRERNIDLSFIQHYYLRGDSLSTKFVREAIGGNYIFPIHYHFTAPTFDTVLVRQNYPDAIIFKKELQSWQMPEKKDDFPTLTGAYLGQTPPGLIPEVFAPGIVSDTSWAEHSQVAISPIGDEIFWSAWTSKYKTEDGKYNTEQLFYSKLQDGKWTKPKIAEFTLNNPHGLNGGPVFSPDGKRLYFYEVKSPWRSSVKRTLFVEKKDGNWSDPKDAGDEYNSGTNNYSPIFTENGTAYKYSGKILKYKFNDDKFTFIDTVKINKEYRVGWNVYVSPKEEFMIFAAFHKDNYGDFDLYISFNNNGSWGNPINLGDKINSDKRERFPIVSPDGKYLFFMRHTETQDFFWVSTDVLDELKKESLAKADKSTNTEDVIIAKKIKLNSAVLGEERTLFVSTPSNYDLSQDSYPVMYVLDGSESTIHYASGLVADLSKRILCPEMIIVAIANTDRFRDMTPTKYDANPNIVSGKADQFLKFIETELFPFIEKNYRTSPYKIFAGHSAAGMCVTHAFLSHNNMFNSYIGMSPCLWWDSNLFVKTAEENISTMNLKYKQYYFSTGSNERSHYINSAQAFFKTLTDKSPEDFTWKFDLFENEDHGSHVTQAMYSGLRFIFDGWKYNFEKVREEGLKYITDFYNQQTEKYGYERIPSEVEMTGFGYSMLRSGKLEDAIQMFKNNIERNPQSANAYDCLAEAYLASGNFDLSIQNYEKAVHLGTITNDVQLDIYKRNLEKAKASNK